MTVKFPLFKFCLFNLISLPLHAEPWLSTRYAQNCAGCHAPGRINKAPSKRRCSLSCQGCHVNPNGGGLRSHYGKWTENRWLNTMKVDSLMQKKFSANFYKQTYGHKPTPEQVAQNKIHHLVEMEDRPDNLEGYGRDIGQEMIMSDSHDHYMYFIPDEDPYLLMEKSKIDAGADFRWLNADMELTRAGKTNKAKYNFLMSADASFRYRPFYRHLHFVYEGRFLGNREKTTFDSSLKTSETRSLYALLEDLPYNFFVMGGYYRPLFGHYTPDHTQLSQKMTSYALTGSSRSQTLLFKAASIGTAPNVPYINFHLIQGNPNMKDSNVRGYAANLGMRFVSYGASMNYSYWKHKNENDVFQTQVELHSLHIAAGFWHRLYLSYEALSLARDDLNDAFKQGGLHTLESRFRFINESYLVWILSRGNVTEELAPGGVNQQKIGLRSFLTSGVDVSLFLDKTDTNSHNSPDTKTKFLSLQLHLFI